MAKRKRSGKKINLVVGNDPSLWRYASLSEAISDSTDLLAHLIHESTSRTDDAISDTDSSTSDVYEVERT